MIIDFIRKDILGSNYRLFSNKIVVRRSKYTVNIPEIDSCISYLFGAIAGDGNITLIKRGDSKYPRTKIRIINSSKSFLCYLNRILIDKFGYHGRIYHKSENCYVLESNNKIVWLYIVKFSGLRAGKKIGLKVPSVVKSYSLLKSYIAGLFDTDGYYSRGRYGLMMTSKNLDFLYEIKSLSKSFYNLNFLGPYTDKIEFNRKTFERSQINLSTKCNDDFVKLIPMKIKSGPSRIRTCDIHLS
jgi:hypothetical protein